MGFSSVDDFINKTTNLGQTWETGWNKALNAATNFAGNIWGCLFIDSGIPGPGVLSSGSNLSFQSLCEQSSGSIYNGGAVAPFSKYVLNASVTCAAAASAPVIFMLVDLLGYYPMTTVTTVRKSIYV